MSSPQPVEPPQGFIVRPAKKADRDPIRDLVIGARLNPGGLDWRHFAVIESPQGAVAACGQVKSHRDGSRELASLVVEPQQRGRGLGRAVVSALLVEHGPPLYLMCRSTLTGYYARFGFEELSPEMEQPPYFRRVRRLFGTLVDWVASDGSYLAVMVWRG